MSLSYFEGYERRGAKHDELPYRIWALPPAADCVFTGTRLMMKDGNVDRYIYIHISIYMCARRTER